MKKTFKNEKLRSLYPFFIFAVALIIVYRISYEIGVFGTIFSWLWTVFSPFFYGLVIAYIANIPIGALQRLYTKSSAAFFKKRARMFAVISFAIILIALIALALNIIIPAIVNSITFFIANFETYIADVGQFITQFNENAPFGWNISYEAILDMIGDFFSDITVDALLSPINALVGAATAAFTGVIAFISSIYILYEKDKIKKGAHRLLRVCMAKEIYAATVENIRKLNLNFRQYLRTQTIDGLILGTLATIQLMIIGSPFALILGIMLGVVNYVPYFGSIIGTIVAVLVVMFTQGFTMGLIAALTLLITQQIDANVIQPRLMSGSFSLSPLFVIISITVGGAIAGVVGMIIAIPIVAVLKDISGLIIRYYERKRFGEPELANETENPPIENATEIETEEM